LIAGALSAFVLCSGCAKNKIELQTVEIIPEKGLKKDDNINIDIVINETVVKVAPIFVHGEGSGALGCIVVAPPVFISEKEAMELIVSEFKKAGLIVETEAVDKKIQFKAKQIAVSCISEEERDEMDLVDVEFNFDGYDKSKNFIFEYVAKKDYEKFAVDLEGCSVSEFDTKRAAEILRSEIIKKGESNGVVFYDPIVKIDSEGYSDDEELEKVRDKAKDLLTAQVSDFLIWAENEGLIK
jgi:hypothetical protein